MPFSSRMLVFLNGEFVPEERATVSIFDRSFLYGDGLFETMRVAGGRPYCWKQHWARLEAGASFLNIGLSWRASEVEAAAVELAKRNGVKEAVLRLTVSRGVGKRGYSPRGADTPTIAMVVDPSPDLASETLRTWSLVTSSVQLRANDPLASFKTCNRLPQVLARAEADAAGASEALLSNSDGWVVEGGASNLFWVKGGMVCTPPRNSGILSGITRSVILELCPQIGLETQETNLTSEELRGMDGVFLSLSSLGIVEAVSLDGQVLQKSEVTRRLHKAYVERLRKESDEAEMI